VSFDFFESDGQVFPLSGGREPIVLRSDGMDHPVNARSRRRVVTKYEDITHLATTNQAAWVASRKSLYILPRSLFAQTGGPENLLRALARRIAERPGSEAQLARMAAIERLSTARRPLRATLGLAVLCLAVFCAQLFGGESVFLVGNFSEGFFFAGDTWRVITANLLHAAPQFPIHLGLNMIALVILGALVERPLGAARTIAIMGASGVTAMLATTVAETAPVVGASGIVFGLVGAAVWLEFAWADRLPAWWRYPRRSLLILLVVNGVIGFVVPFISGTAHLGGFVGGLAAAALLVGGGRGLGESSPLVRATSGAVVALTVFAIASAGLELARPGEYTARHAARLATLPDVSPDELNELAWIIAISSDPSRELVEAALLLAERAVAETHREDPNILDTLAEVQFQLGWYEEALRTIDEAIARAPDEEYFREQRRRFTGERAADDRPPAPPPAWFHRDAPAEPALLDSEDGIHI